MLKQLRGAVTPPRQIIKVTTINSDGTVSGVTPSGHSVRAIGSSQVDNHIYVQEGRVLGIAPELPHIEIEV